MPLRRDVFSRLDALDNGLPDGRHRALGGAQDLALLAERRLLGLRHAEHRVQHPALLFNGSHALVQGDAVTRRRQRRPAGSRGDAAARPGSGRGAAARRGPPPTRSRLVAQVFFYAIRRLNEVKRFDVRHVAGDGSFRGGFAGEHEHCEAG